jgi:hypothetical protein
MQRPHDRCAAQLDVQCLAPDLGGLDVSSRSLTESADTTLPPASNGPVVAVGTALLLVGSGCPVGALSRFAV